jgi:hypothetical protein
MKIDRHPAGRPAARIAGSALAALLLVAPVASAGPQEPGAPAPNVQQDIEGLRRQIEEIRRDYESRLAALEKRLSEMSSHAAAAEGAAIAPTPGAESAAATPPAAPAEPPLAQAAQAPPPAEPAPTPAPNAFAKVFNPDIAVIGNMLGAIGENHVEDSPALQLDEAEASFQAVVDPYARGDFYFAFGPEGVEIEEGFITFTALPGGLLARAGKMRSQFGKVNTMHTHALPWTDRPLVTRNLVGGDEGLSDSGLSLSKLLVNPVFFLEATGEVLRGESGVFQGNGRSKVSYTGRLRGYRDLTESTNLDLGTSFAWGHTDAEEDFDATRRLIGVDATLRWRPLRRAIYRRFIGRTELVWSEDRLSASRGTSFGMYASGEYQFARRWFGGARYDYSERPLAPPSADKGGALTLTFWPSEFSQVRGQYRHTRYAEQVTADEFLFQFLFSIGAHGAHPF